MCIGLVACAPQPAADRGVAGRAVGPEGRPLEGVSIDLVSEQEGRRGTTTGPDGRFQILPVEPGRWTLTAGPALGLQAPAPMVIEVPGPDVLLEYR